MNKWKSRPLYLIIIYGIASFCFGFALIYEYINRDNKTIKIDDLYIPILNFIGFLLILIYQYNIKWIEGFSFILILCIISSYILYKKISLFKE